MTWPLDGENWNDDPYRAVGRMALAAGRVENGGYLIARSMGVADPEKMGIQAALRKVKMQAKLGMAPWSACPVAELLDWIDQVGQWLEARNRWVHAAVARIASGPGSWSQVSIHTRTGGRVDLDLAAVDDINEISDKLGHVEKLAGGITRSLLIPVRDGVFSLHANQMGGPTVASAYVFELADGTWPDRPSEDELEKWWAGLMQDGPKEWANWPPPLDVQRAIRILDAVNAGDIAKVADRISPTVKIHVDDAMIGQGLPVFQSVAGSGDLDFERSLSGISETPSPRALPTMVVLAGPAVLGTRHAVLLSLDAGY